MIIYSTAKGIYIIQTDLLFPWEEYIQLNIENSQNFSLLKYNINK